MILFIILALILLILIMFLIAVVSIGGSIFIVVFGDVIVCIAIITWIIVHLRKKKG